MIATLLLVPTVAGLLCMVFPAKARSRLLLVAAAIIHATLVAAMWLAPPRSTLSGWIALDPLGLLFLSVTSVLFLAGAIYGVGYLEHDEQTTARPASVRKESMFVGGLLLFLATMTLVTVSQNFGLLWVGIEATTLTSAPLIYFHRNHRSLEATWKYLLLCSVGIALALLATFFLAASWGTTEAGDLQLPHLIGRADTLNPVWLKAAYVTFIVGYGTKMGLAPMHNWLPDAHSESPSLVSALMSGALLNCAFLGILRMSQVGQAAGLGAFGGQLLTGFGLLSMGVAAIFIISQPDYKRLLAYSSVEHMGILALGVGLGGLGTYAALLHSVNHSLTKAALFLTAGNLLAWYQSTRIADVRGLWYTMPVSGGLWIAGVLAIVGSPPFGPFVSEFTLLRAAIGQGHPLVATLYLMFLALIFVGMVTAAVNMTQGRPVHPRRARESLLSVVPPLGLSLAVLFLGWHIPEFLQHLLEQASAMLGAG